MLSLGSYIDWHEWFQDKNFNHRLYDDYYCDGICSPDFNNLIQLNIIDDFECDITDITGISASKSDIRSISSFEDMAELMCSRLISNFSEENLNKIIKHFSKSCLVKNFKENNFRSGNFVRYCWNKKIFWINIDGSHNFAAVYYISKKLNKPLTLVGRLKSYSINHKLLKRLLTNFNIFMIPKFSKSKEIFGLVKIIENFKSPYSICDVPFIDNDLYNKKYLDKSIIFLPHKHPRSDRISNLLKKADTFDFGAVLSKIGTVAN